jgi:hypothetical protein
MTVSALSPVSLGSYFDPATGAVQQVALYFYRASTLDPLTVYADALLATPHPVPVLTTGSGRVPPVWIGEIPAPGYRMRAFNQYSELVEDIDNLPGAVAPATGGGGGGTDTTDPTQLLVTGDIITAFSNATPRSGAVRCNGGSIGSASSTANERANIDCHALFVWLWGQDIYGTLSVLPSRGGSAEGDWSSNKTISVPDLRCAALVGMDGMGSTLTHRLDGIPFAYGDAAKIGSYAGAASFVMAGPQLANHNHALHDPTHQHYSVVPAHNHTWSGSVDNTGSHQHFFTTGVESAGHVHTIPSGGSSIALPTGSPSGAFVANMVATATGGESATHVHTGTTDPNGLHTHAVSGTVGTQAAVGVASDARSCGITIDSAGSNAPISITQLSYLLCFFMKL